MFSYYGTKAKLAPRYPPPVFDVVIEPFAGAAGYSCLYSDLQVRLYDANPKIAAVWSWLIGATPADVDGLPDVKPGDSLADISSLSDAERWLIGFCINPASTCPKVTASKRSAWARYRTKIARFVPRIKHWTIDCASWDTIPNQKATWFVDPPYQVAGKYYFGFKAIPFHDLGRWCAQREGQAIVCENAGADWLPFHPLVVHQGMTKRQTEVVWYGGDQW